MSIARAIVVAAALIAGAVLAHYSWAQFSYPMTFGYVVATCGTLPASGSSGPYTWAAGTQAPFTLDTTGKICVSQ